MSSEKKPKRKPRDLNDKKDRTLYVRLPHTIRKKEEVEQLFLGNFKVNLLRQSSRHCTVVFPSVEEKIKNLKAAKGKEIDGQSVIVSPLHLSLEKNVTQVKKKKKKIVMPTVKEEQNFITQTLFITNIKCGTKPREVQEAIEGCGTVIFLKAHTPRLRSAIAKINSIQIAAEYLTKKRPWPVVKGNKLQLKPDTRVKHKAVKAKKAKAAKAKSNANHKPVKASRIEPKPKSLKSQKPKALNQPTKARTNLTRKVTKQKV